MMRYGDLSGRVTWSGLAAVVALSAVAGWAAGVEGATGVAGGGAVALLNFRWLARSVANVVALVRDGGSGGAGLRGAGRPPPLAVTAGLSVLPPILIAQGLRAAREAD